MHLEEYEDWNFRHLALGLGGQHKSQKIKRTNYNFYCIEKTPDLIDERIIDDYIAILAPLREELLEVHPELNIIAYFYHGESAASDIAYEVQRCNNN